MLEGGHWVSEDMGSLFFLTGPQESWQVPDKDISCFIETMGRAQKAGGEGREKEKIVSFWEVSILWGECGCLGLLIQSDKARQELCTQGVQERRHSPGIPRITVWGEKDLFLQPWPQMAPLRPTISVIKATNPALNHGKRRDETAPAACSCAPA